MIDNVDMRTSRHIQIKLSYQVASSFALLGLISIFVVPPSALALMGIGYSVLGGSPLEKIHPSTYLLSVSLMIFILDGSCKYKQIGSSIIYYFICLTALMMFIVLFRPVPFSNIIDTFLLPGVVLVHTMLWDTRRSLQAKKLLDLLMLLNASIAIGENLSGSWRLFPLTIGDASLGIIELNYEWRPTAFMGHPLTGAIVTGCFLLILRHSEGRSRTWRTLLFSLNLIALLFYGSRSAVATFGLWLSVEYFVKSLRLLGGKNFRIADVVKFFLIFGAAGSLLVFLMTHGLLDRFYDRIQDDNGSAGSRVIAFDIVSSLSFTDLLWGVPSGDEISDLARRFGTSYGIENFWLNFVLLYGLLGCTIFFPGLFFFMFYTVDKFKSSTASVLLYMMTNASFGVSLSAKSLMLAMVIALLAANYSGRLSGLQQSSASN